MIGKRRVKPVSLEKLESARRRVPKNHPKAQLIKERLAISTAGYRGECAVDYPLSRLPEKDYSIFHNIRLKESSHFFQIDTLIITLKFALILEIKNFAGAIYFDEKLNQLIRTIDDRKEAFRDPLLQIYFQENQLKIWLQKHGFSQLPVISLIVISNPNTLIETSQASKSIYQKVIHNEYLPVKIQQLEKNYPQQKLSEKELKKLIRLIKKQDTPLDSPLLAQLEIPELALIKGVHCPQCSLLPIPKKYGGWRCPNCSSKNKYAYLPSIKDYSLLINPNFTNREIRNFLEITSPDYMHRLLICKEIASSGATKAKIYSLNN